MVPPSPGRKPDADRGEQWLRNAVRKYREKKVRRPGDAAIQLQNRDTQTAMSQRGVVELLAAICYLYYRMGFRSSECAALFSLKGDRVREILFRLQRTYNRFLAPGAARMATRVRIVPGVGDLYSVRQRLHNVGQPPTFEKRTEAQKAARREKYRNGKRAELRNGQE